MLADHAYPGRDVEKRKSEAIAVLKKNDRGNYTVPTDSLYPFQWNWDSAFCAMGFATFDIPRAWTELETLYSGQWSDGFLPHIIFHQTVESYFPGPEVWGTNKTPPSSGISQPPLTSTAVRFILDRAGDDEESEARAAALYPRIVALHDWWARVRDPGSMGLVGVLHPWESGADNSPIWDASLRAVPATNTPYHRRDVTLLDAEMRPKPWEYDRYLYLVEFYRNLEWDGSRMWEKAPFKVADIGLNSILARDERDLIVLAGRFGTAAERMRLIDRAQRRQSGLERLWDEQASAYYSLDLITGHRIPVASHAGFLPLWGGLDDKRRIARLAAELTRWMDMCAFGAPSMAPDDPLFERRRYWRGPVWANVNWMLGDGLARYGHTELAERIRLDTRKLILKAGFCEYYDPISGDGLGGSTFSWTAATGLAWALD